MRWGHSFKSFMHVFFITVLQCSYFAKRNNFDTWLIITLPATTKNIKTISFEKHLEISQFQMFPDDSGLVYYSFWNAHFSEQAYSLKILFSYDKHRFNFQWHAYLCPSCGSQILGALYRHPLRDIPSDVWTLFAHLSASSVRVCLREYLRGILNEKHTCCLYPIAPGNYRVVITR